MIDMIDMGEYYVNYFKGQRVDNYFYYCMISICQDCDNRNMRNCYFFTQGIEKDEVERYYE